MSLQFDKLKIKLIFELDVDIDIGMDPKQVVNSIANEIQIKKNHAGFPVGDFDMEYEIRKPSEFMEV